MSGEELHHIPARPPAPVPDSAPRTPPSTPIPHPALRTPHAVRPLLKWAGGKRQLLPALRAFFPSEFGRYFEPFVGSGAVFFDLTASGRLAGHRVCLSDSNADLIGCYRGVRDDPAAVIRELEALAAGRAADPAAHFYAVRDRFNAARLTRVNGRYPPRLAAMLIYLNRTGFNGLFRLNRRGQFNVPAGRYTRPRIADAGLVRAVAAALGRRGVSLRHEAFETAAARAQPGDFLYFDPPYVPLTVTSNFTGYTGQPFGPDDQTRLRDAAVDLCRRGCHVMISNSSAPAVAALYAEAAARTGGALRVFELPARRAINSRASGRGPVTEFLLTNLRPRPADAPTPRVRRWPGI
jgi:DNA adenine methylase